MLNSDSSTQSTGNAVKSAGIRLNGITVSINGTNLFHDLNMIIQAGNWTCLLGPSGVGKSMLLRVILGLVDTSEKSALRCSGDVKSTDGSALGGSVSFMAQRDLLFPWLNVRDNVTLGSRFREGRSALKSAEHHANELLDAVGMIKHAEQMPASLSGGMAQRVALARTLAENRPVILMDEPFSALDAITRIKIQELSAKLLKGRTVLMVTHDPLEALRLGHQVYVLSGRPAKPGAPLELNEQPPRAVDNPDILNLQGELLKQLAEAVPS